MSRSEADPSGPWIARRADAAELEACLEVRHRVFVLGQGVPPELEQDGLDAVCAHFVVLDHGNVIGTARLRELGDVGKAERVAVLENERGRGVGRALMTALEQEAKCRGAREVALSAQEASIPFYERLGYRGEGERYLEAGIPHRRMRKGL